MKKLLLCSFLLISIFSFAQQEIVGLKAFGIAGKSQIETVRGFKPRPELSFGKFYTSHFFVGVNTSMEFQNFEDRFSRISMIGSPPEDFSYISKTAYVESNVFVKYYLGESRFRPFFFGEFGLAYYSNKFMGASSNSSRVDRGFSPNYGVGAGLSWFPDKNRRFLVEGLFSINNFANSITVFNGNSQFMTQGNSGFGQLRLGVSYLIKHKKVK